MEKELKGSAWALSLWGAFSIIFGVLIVAWPEITLKALLVVLGVYLLAVGAVTLIGSVIGRGGHWVAGMSLGFLSILAGLYVFANPEITALVTLSLIAIWTVVTGTIMLISGFSSGKDGVWLVLSGAVSTLFGLYIFTNPQEGALVLVWLIGIEAIISGIFLAIGSFKLCDVSRKIAKAKR